ncbi:hypothetical protein CUR178_01055 [Leishmania enriettii]|uniref:Protein kinase domain-containing protein n=1 Tax=Leishmania enriettii TaxID=5663 RepID=A0A836FQV1_LEIEN|nr:hypothetical protein CUR178_01055 [Leishmania enriettii]
MDVVLFDTDGGAYRLETAVGAECGSYGALFSRASTYRARRLPAPCTEDISRPADSEANESRTKSSTGDVLVTYIPLTTSLQESAIKSEAASLHLVLQNIRVRRQVDHPYLRTLTDAFYTDQVLSSPSSVSDGVGAVVMRKRPGSPLRGTSPQGVELRRREGTEEDSGGAERLVDTAASPGISSPTMTALVVVEEYVEGCSLLDYVDAVAKRHLIQGNPKMQDNAAAIGCQVAQILLHLHAVGHMVCRNIPLDCVHLDAKRGCVRLRLPLTTAAMLDVVESSTGSCQATVLTSRYATPEDEPTNTVSGAGKKIVCAPEMSNMSCWSEIPSAPWGARSVGADVWALGLLMLQLCCLHHDDFSAAINASELLVVIRRHLHHLAYLLPSETEEGIAGLIRSCLEFSAEKRPTLQALLQSRTFAKHCPSKVLQPNGVIITLAEAVKAVQRKENLLPSMQPAAQLLHTSDVVCSDLSSPTAEGLLVSLSLEDLIWETPPSFCDAFVPMIGSPPLANDVAKLPGGSGSQDTTASGATQPLERSPPSLAAATKQALQDVVCLHGHYRGMGVVATPKSTPTALSAHQRARAAWRERVQCTRQLPRDITSTKSMMAEITDHFAVLEHADPRLCLRFLELLMEGFENCPSDVTAVSDSVVLAEALLLISATDTVDAGAARPVREDSPIGDATEHLLAEQKETFFNVAETLRVMPSMPAHMISSDRAANTSAVLYNSWLRKQRKKHLRMDEY